MDNLGSLGLQRWLFEDFLLLWIHRIFSMHLTVVSACTQMSDFLFPLLQPLPCWSLNTTAEGHFATILKDHMVGEIELVESEYSTPVKATITGAASDCCQARRPVVNSSLTMCCWTALCIR